MLAHHVFLTLSYLTSALGMAWLIEQTRKKMQAEVATAGALRILCLFFASLLFFCWSVPA